VQDQHTLCPHRGSCFSIALSVILLLHTARLMPLQLRWLQLALANTRSDKDTAIVRHLLASLSEEEGAEDDTVF